MGILAKSLGTAAIAGLGLITTSSDASAQFLSLNDFPNSLDKKAFFTNFATDTSLSEKCKQLDAETIECKLYVTSSMAMLQFHQTDTYSFANGSLNIETEMRDYEGWSGDATSARDEFIAGSSLVEFDPSSILATPVDGGQLLQNNVGLVTGEEGEVQVCSFIPVTQNRAFNVCYEFNQNEGSVRTTVVPSASWGQNVVQAEANWAKRDYDFAHDNDSNRYELRVEPLKANGFNPTTLIR